MPRLVLAVLFALLLPATASAGTISASGTTITYQAAPGEENFFTVNWGNSAADDTFIPSFDDHVDITVTGSCEYWAGGVHVPVGRHEPPRRGAARRRQRLRAVDQRPRGRPRRRVLRRGRRRLVRQRRQLRPARRRPWERPAQPGRQRLGAGRPGRRRPGQGHAPDGQPHRHQRPDRRVVRRRGQRRLPGRGRQLRPRPRGPLRHRGRGPDPLRRQRRPQLRAAPQRVGRHR